jgi:hypothetical protein
MDAIWALALTEEGVDCVTRESAAGDRSNTDEGVAGRGQVATEGADRWARLAGS